MAKGKVPLLRMEGKPLLVQTILLLLVKAQIKPEMPLAWVLDRLVEWGTDPPLLPLEMLLKNPIRTLMPLLSRHHCATWMAHHQHSSKFFSFLFVLVLS